MYDFVRIDTAFSILVGPQIICNSFQVKVLKVKNEKEHDRRKIADYRDQQTLQQAHEFTRIRVMLEIPDTPKHIRRAEDDQNGK